MADNAGTWNHDGDLVLMIRHADGACSTRFPQVVRYVAVASGLTVRNFQQLLPDSNLEGSTGKVQWQVELRALRQKVLINLPGKDVVCFFVDDAIPWYLVAEMDRRKPFFSAGQRDRAQWSAHDGVSHHA